MIAPSRRMWSPQAAESDRWKVSPQDAESDRPKLLIYVVNTAGLFSCCGLQIGYRQDPCGQRLVAESLPCLELGL